MLASPIAPTFKMHTELDHFFIFHGCKPLSYHLVPGLLLAPELVSLCSLPSLTSIVAKNTENLITVRPLLLISPVPLTLARPALATLSSLVFLEHARHSSQKAFPFAIPSA